MPEVRARIHPAVLAMTLLVSVLLLDSPAVADSLAEGGRISGQNRYETAAAVAAQSHPGGATTVFVATGLDFPDALAAAPAASRSDAPLLLVTDDEVPPATSAAIQRLDPERIVVLGGEDAISADVAARLSQAAPTATIRRVFGANRYATAARISQIRPLPTGDVVYVASGEKFPDSLAAGPAAAVEDGVILLTTATALPAETVEAIRRLAPAELVLLGGPAAIDTTAEAELRTMAPELTRVSGADRFATAAAISRRSDASRSIVVRADDYADGLAAGPYAARSGASVLLAESSCLPAPTLAVLDDVTPASITLVGGPAVLDEHVAARIPCPEVVADGLSIPWGLTFGPEGSSYVGERDTGRILQVDGTGPPSEVHRVTVDPRGSGGLLGLAADRDTAGVVYAYITTPTDNRVVRVTLGDSVEPVLTGIPRGTAHFGGGLALGDDGLLYVATGDGRREDAPRAAQDPDDLAGKILRITRDGDVPADNPIPGSPVYALGFRNPQALAWNEQGWLLATDFGPERDDEVNRIVPGGNYGWPDVTGNSDHPTYLDPLIVRQPAEASWSGLTVLRKGAIPAWQGSVVAGSLRGERLWRFELDTDGSIVASESLFVGDYGRIRTVVEAPDGALWFTTSNRDNRGDPPRPVDDRVVRLGPPFGGPVTPDG